MTKQKYRFNWGYASGIGVWAMGTEVELDFATAAHLLRDSPGCISPVEDEPAAVADRAVDAPPSDRMQRRRNDRGNESPIDRTTFRATKDKGGA